MTREEAIQVLQTALTSPFIYGEYAEAIDMAIEALRNCSEIPNGSDIISRQDAIDAFAKWRIMCALYPSDEICNILKSLPSADIQEVESATIYNEGITFSYRKKGKWERVLYKRQGHEEVIVDGHSWRCTNCGDARKRNDIDMKYCPNCGAKMRGEEE